MSADQNKNKKPSGRSTRDKHHDQESLTEKRGDTEQSFHRPYRGYDEEKTKRTDQSEQMGEFSNWSKGSRIG